MQSLADIGTKLCGTLSKRQLPAGMMAAARGVATKQADDQALEKTDEPRRPSALERAAVFADEEDDDLFNKRNLRVEI